MTLRPRARLLCLLLVAAAAPGCGGPAGSDATTSTLAAAATAAPVLPPAASPVATQDGLLPLLEVFRSPACGCCGAWVEHMQHAGFPVQVREVDDLEAVRRQMGVPFGKGSCHTARIDGYIVEGHVPAADIRRLLAQRPNARGLVLPGMPAGSPGMEMPDGHVQPYTVELVGHDGVSRAWSRHGD
ncbi:DUF411 domain-containing protein [Pseudoxanthomonas daejeonensis]|uniref:DUF411 domain-containing protein n=1 Tax=Pseudoxanthomonas daejeonensis TaxID=266062 RepID=UPI00192EF4A6|nr:DUF411 domain-containing protein [Pseudoxanthomonas daejeonensis]